MRVVERLCGESVCREGLAAVLPSTLRRGLVYLRLLGQTEGQEIQSSAPLGGRPPEFVLKGDD